MLRLLVLCLMLIVPAASQPANEEPYRSQFGYNMKHLPETGEYTLKVRSAEFGKVTEIFFVSKSRCIKVLDFLLSKVAVLDRKRTGNQAEITVESNYEGCDGCFMVRRWYRKEI